MRQDDAAPEEVADVGAKGVDLALVAVECEGVVPAALLDPERLVEALPQLLRLPFQPGRELALAPHLARKLRDAPFCVVDVALHLARRNRGIRQAAVVEALRIPGVLPRLVLEPAVRATLVLDETVTVPIAVLVDPFECQHRRPLEISYERGVVRPPPHLRKQDEVERRRVGRAVVPLVPGAGGLSVTHLVDDLSGLGVDRRIVFLGLQVGEYL